MIKNHLETEVCTSSLSLPAFTLVFRHRRSPLVAHLQMGIQWCPQVNDRRDLTVILLIIKVVSQKYGNSLNGQGTINTSVQV